MTSKLKAIYGVVVAAVTICLSQVAVIGPSLQDKFVQALQACLPVSWRPEIAALSGLVSMCALVYSVLHAAKSGPQTPPTNPPTK